MGVTHTGGDVDRPDLATDLRRLVEGDVRFDDYTRELFATDASAYEVMPVGVVMPRSSADVATVVSYCAKREIPVLPRGGGTSLGGQAVNEAVVLDFSRYMDDVRAIDPDAGTATVGAGTVLAELNEALAPHGLKFAPDPAAGDRSTVGGAIGNNSTGSHSLYYGKTDAYVRSCEVVLADGSVETVGEIGVDELRERADPAAEDLLSRIYAAVVRILDEEAVEVRERYPDLKRNVSGYNLDVLVAEAAGEWDPAGDGPTTDPGTVNLARLFAGSEGTLGVVTSATVDVVPIPEETASVLLCYESVGDAVADVEHVLAHDPSATELIDDVLIDLAAETTEFGSLVERLPAGTRAALLVEFYAEDREEAATLVAGLLEDRVPGADPAATPPAFRPDTPDPTALAAEEAYEQAARDRLWQLRKAGAPILLSRTTDEKHVTFIEDCAVPAERLPAYVEGLNEILDEHDTYASVYGHAGPGVLHVRPLIDTKSELGREEMVDIADAVTDLAVELGGAASGEHGDGRARTQWNRKMYGDHLLEVFRDLKAAFDPDGILNPGQICGDVRMTENLRFGPDYEYDPGFEPALDWQVDQGMQGMVELCHGCGGCRGGQSTTGGVMCPTYRASEEEIATTRGRANMLRQAMSGSLPRDELFAEEFAEEVLDLCIGCKGCARDCPSEVDLAKLKVEVTHARHEREGATRREKLFAAVDAVATVGSRLAPVSNWLANLPGAGLVAERALGIAADRTPPTFRRTTLQDWYEERGGFETSRNRARAAFADRGPWTDSEASEDGGGPGDDGDGPDASVDGDGSGDDRDAADHGVGDAGQAASTDPPREVVLFPDTYTNYTRPEAGIAAVEVLEAAGVAVRMAELTDSGRPALSKGFVDRARRTAAANVAALVPAIEAGADVVVVEPSDAVMFQSDYLDLLSTEGAKRLAEHTYGVCEYLDENRLAEALPVDAPDEHLTYHGHCHQKAVATDHHAVGVLRRVGYDVDPLDSGCCGMAGSFGYEAEHYDLSTAIASILVDQIEASPGGEVVAPGASCRTQLGDVREAPTPPTPIEKVAAALSEP